ncbi:SsgA family sporulation/cell division regulator [Kibdelosporangium lantanae]|uniref:SsgA family sporulation/cell division regulator n=1 Tax=Kibdelosporangium lantanae TaxID=1497396 RepID=A0ABW3MCE7_9PSEU
MGKQTIYRWWPSKGAILLDVLIDAVGAVSEMPDTGDITADLRTQMTAVTELFRSDFARFYTGLIAEAGDGDVRIRPAVDDPEVVVIELSSPSGHAVFEASAQELADFLDRTYDVVVPGNEHMWVNVDEALTHLISNDLT